MFNRSIFQTSLVCALLGLSANLVFAQFGGEAKPKANEAARPVKKPKEEKKPEKIVIANEPKTVDPAQYMSTALAKKITVDFTDSSLKEITAWLKENEDIVMLVNKRGLEEVGMLISDPISDRLDDMPIYMLFNRLRMMGLDWYVEDQIVHVTSFAIAEEHMTTVTYPVGDLLDAGSEIDQIAVTVTTTVEPESWEELGGEGVISFLGDVMLVRQTDEIHRHVRGLLQTIRKHARQTYVLDAPQHEDLRKKLDVNITVNFRDEPLSRAAETIGKAAKLDIRLDTRSLDDIGLSERTPVSLSLSDTKVKTVLKALLTELDLTWFIQDGVLWMTTPEAVEDSLKTVVFDVRDLCNDEKAANALIEAITSQASPESWEELGGPGAIIAYNPGTLVVSQTENLLDEVLYLLETYRKAIKISKPRKRKDELDPKEVISVYYRMETGIAMEMNALLTMLVQPDSWKTDANKDAPGEIIRVNSVTEISSAEGKASDAPAFLIKQSVLIVKHTRETHDEIKEVISRVQKGDKILTMEEKQKAMGGFGGGGGFFSIPLKKIAE
ncbi:MAG: hypothetical protein COA78_32220 [Blastopirellula sp.]|nr:MAG: hypothetical protein COA78_32220 [Blastopirellula sp.]